MKKFLVVGDRSFVDDELRKMHAFGDYLRDTVNGFGIVDTVSVDKIVFSIQQGSLEAFAPDEGIDLKDYDAIYVRSLRVLGCFVSQFATYHNIPCINDYSLYYTGTKASQSLAFLEAGVDFLPTYYAVDNRILTNFVAKKVGYPYILKANNGAQGNSNYLIRSPEEADKVLRDEPDVDFVAQEFCPNDRDYRLLMVGSSELLFERRGGPDTHLNNTSKGGSATRVDTESLPPNIYAEARAIAKKLGLVVAGFDVIPNLETKNFYFLEVNSQPQLRSGMLLDEKQELVRNLFAGF